MADKDLILAIDCGTQNVKAAVFDPEGRELALARRAHGPDIVPQPRWMEHDPEDYYQKSRDAVREVIDSLGADVSRLRAVGLCSQRGTAIPLDKDGKPTRNAIVYQDNRFTENLGPLRNLWGLFFSIIGMKSAIEYVRTHSRFIWIKQYQPDVYEKTAVFTQVASYLNFRLTGEINESVGMMVGMFPLDYKKLDWYPFKGIHDIFGVTPAQLPPLLRPGSIAGHITEKASADTGIPKGLPVVVGGGDIQSAVVGMGVTDETKAALSLGTTLDFDIPYHKHISDKALQYLAWPAAVPDQYVLEAGVGSGFLTVTWFKNEIATHEAQLAENSGKATEDILDEAIANIPPGSLGLMVHPYWTPPFHRDEARGSIIGLTMSHDRPHIYRAILEGLALETLNGYDVIRKKTGIEIEEIRVSGGASQSDQVLQILADVFQVPTVRMEVQEAAALGSAVSAAVGSGLYPTISEAVNAMTHPKTVFTPNRGNRDIYRFLYNKYVDLYPKVADHYKETAFLLETKDA